MKQVVQNARTGALDLIEVPTPRPGPGQVLVRTKFSVVSPGTDMLAMSFARMSLAAKARSRPDLVRQVARKLRQEGPLPTYRAVTNRLDAPQSLGYSSAGIVEEAGAGVCGFAPGDAVACAGAGYAIHAEFAIVPENLAAAIPPGLALERAAFGTLGAIALQGVRTAQPTLGETAVVVGLGLIGQLTVQLLRANGCRVLGIDLAPDRVKASLDQGARWGATPDDDLEPWIACETGGHGADFVVVTAASADSGPLSLAARLCRKKGRVSLVGAVPVEVDRRLVYEKELELRMSTSYGPGRYDQRYEESGLDYPIAYVRWTENRNLLAFLDLAATGAVRPDLVDTEIVPFDDAVRVYEEMAAGRRRSLAVVFSYPDRAERRGSVLLSPRTQRPPKGSPGVAFIGAGNYAKAVLLPALGRLEGVRPLTLVTATGSSARRTAERFRFQRCGTDPEEILQDSDVDLVFVATRHDTHADLAVRALHAGKAVWLEKPVGITPEEVASVVAAAAESGSALFVGYNRRFSRHARAIRAFFDRRRSPMAIRYSIAAGRPPAGTWITDPGVGGGRIVGEACHFIDLCAYLTGQPPRGVFARALGRNWEVDDSMVLLLDFPDGSVAVIEYLAQASGQLPKERFEVSSEGSTAICENFRNTHILGGKTIRTLNQDKGQEDAVREALEMVRGGSASPFRLEEIAAVSRATFAALESANTGLRVEVVA